MKLGRIGSGKRGKTDGTSLAATMNGPCRVCPLDSGALAFSDTKNNVVRFVCPQQNSSQTMNPLVQTAVSGALMEPKGLCVSKDNRYLFLCDSGHNRIKYAALPVNSALHESWRESIYKDVKFIPFAGNGRKGWEDGNIMSSSFNKPHGICMCRDGTIAVADTGNHCIRKIRHHQGRLVVETIAGGSIYGSSPVKRKQYKTSFEEQEYFRTKKKMAGYQDGVYSLFRNPMGIVEGHFGELIVTDSLNNMVRCILPPTRQEGNWVAFTIVGQSGSPGHMDGSCNEAQLNKPTDVAVAKDGSLFVCDTGNKCIRQIGGSLAMQTKKIKDAMVYHWVQTIDLDGPCSIPAFKRYEIDMTLSAPTGICIVDPKQYNWASKTLKGKETDTTIIVCDELSHRLNFFNIKQKIMDNKEGSTISISVSETFSNDKPSFKIARSLESNEGNRKLKLWGWKKESSSLNSREDLSQIASSTQDDVEETMKVRNECDKCHGPDSAIIEKILRENEALKSENRILKQIISKNNSGQHKMGGRFNVHVKNSTVDPELICFTC